MFTFCFGGQISDDFCTYHIQLKSVAILGCRKSIAKTTQGLECNQKFIFPPLKQKNRQK